MRKLAAAWILADAAVVEGISIVMLQELNATKAEFEHLRRSYFGKGYRAFWAEGPARADGRPGGGVITLVTRKLRSKFAWRVSTDIGQMVAVQASDTLLVNVYAHPGSGHAQAMLDALQEAVDSDQARSWVAAGDWNCTPEGIQPPSEWCHLSAVMADGKVQPTRWPGEHGTPRCIDYCIAYGKTVRNMAFERFKLSDHKCVSFQIDGPAGGRVQELQLQGHQNLSRPAQTQPDTWLEVAAEIWKGRGQECTPGDFFENVRCTAEPGSAEAQLWVTQTWGDFERALETTLLTVRDMVLLPLDHDPGDPDQGKYGSAATWTAADYTGEANHPRGQGPRRRPARYGGTRGGAAGGKAPKGHVMITKVDRSKGDVITRGTFQERKQANALARLHRLKWLEEHGRGRGEEARALRAKLGKALPDKGFDQMGYLSALTRQQAVARVIDDTEVRLRKLTEERREKRLKDWRSRVQSTQRKAHEWLRDFAPKDVLVKEGETTAQDTNEALGMLRRRWRKVWDREKPAAHRWREKLGQWLPTLPEQEWPELSEEDVREGMRRQAGSSAGPDGWTGDELVDAMFASEAITNLLNEMERAACVPAGWKQYRQAHLPKATPEGGSNTLSAEDFRPICVASAWYRLWATSRVRSEASRRWQDTWWDPDMVGAKKGFESHQAAASAIVAANMDMFVTSWDYSLAFDMADPAIAGHVLSALGLPSNIGNMLMGTWGEQRRWLQLAGCALKEPERVSSSLPQGDPWSPMALCAMLLAPLRQIKHNCEDIHVQLYIDDRTWESPNIITMLRAADYWTQWSQVLGLKENEKKKQWLHRSPRRRRELAAAGIDPATIHDAIDVLGVKITGGRSRALSKKEKKRLETARAQLARARQLPHQRREKREICAAGPVSKAAFGWIEQPMPRGAADQLRQGVATALRPPRQSAPPLRRLAWGHRADPRYRAQQDTIMALARVASKRAHALSDFARELPWQQKGSFAGEVSRHLEWTGWKPMAARWTWKHTGLADTIISLDHTSREWRRPKALGHVLREAWRHAQYDSFIRSKRRDAAIIGQSGVGYDPLRVKAVLRCYNENPGKAMRVLAGAVVSPMCNAVARRDPGLGECPWCGAPQGTLDHIAWACAGVPGRPPVRPADVLQRRLFWPKGTKAARAVDDAIVHWAYTLDDLLLQERYPAGFVAPSGEAAVNVA